MEDLPTWVSRHSATAPAKCHTSTNLGVLAGNVTYEVPGFHGTFYIPADGVNHTPEFTAGAGSREGFKRSIYSGAGMAVVGCQVLADDLFASAVKGDFEAIKPE